MATNRRKSNSLKLGLPTSMHMSRGLVFGIMIIAALLAFEMFNFSTTQFALGDLLGESSFMNFRWATILALAFCGIDFAGIARLFTPEEGVDEPAEVWYLFGAWLLAATMNAMLTWWGVSIAILDHNTLGNAVVPRETLLRVVPIFVAVLVWLSRVLIIGTFSVAGDRLFSQGVRQERSPFQQKPMIETPQRRLTTANARQSFTSQRPAQRPEPRPAARSFQPAPKVGSLESELPQIKPEPTYHPISMRARANNAGRTTNF